MPTYLNAYTLLSKVRIQLNEYSAAYVAGTDTTGAYLNDQIMDGINTSQRFLYNFLLKRIPYEFKEEVSLTGVNSVYTLPADFGVLRYFKDSDGRQIYPVREEDRKSGSQTGSKLLYTRKGNTLVVDQDGVTDVCTLTYYRKARELDQGVSTAGGALSITLATSAKKIVDYYNGMMIENITDDWVDTISDYTTGRVATIGSQTGGTSKTYGIVSDLPEPFHFLLIPRAVFEITGNYPIVKQQPTKTGVQLFNENLAEALSAYAGQPQDEMVEDIWTDYGGASYISHSIIPGHE